LNDHDQEDSRKEDDVLASINTLMVNTSITASPRPTLVIVDADESYKLVTNYMMSNLH
jgi:hypothetical protein